MAAYTLLVMERVGEIELREPRSTDREVVYFAQAEHGGPIKIGVTGRKSVDGRLASLQTGNPYTLVARRLIAWDGPQGAHGLERALHTYFRGYRLAGEWFTPGPDLLVLAKATNETPIERDVVEAARRTGYEDGHAEGWSEGRSQGWDEAQDAVLWSLGLRSQAGAAGSVRI